MISLQGSQGERGDRGETGEGGEQVSNDDSFHLCHLGLLYERSIVFKYFGSRLVFFIKVFFTLNPFLLKSFVGRYKIIGE